MQPRYRQQVRHSRCAEGLLYGIVQAAFVCQQHGGFHAVQLPGQPAAQDSAPPLAQPVQRKARRTACRKGLVTAQVFRLQIDALAVAAQAVFVVGQFGQGKLRREPLPCILPGERQTLYPDIGGPAVDLSQPQRAAQSALAVRGIGICLNDRRAGHNLPGQRPGGPHPDKGEHQKPRQATHRPQQGYPMISAPFPAEKGQPYQKCRRGHTDQRRQNGRSKLSPGKTETEPTELSFHCLVQEERQRL